VVTKYSEPTSSRGRRLLPTAHRATRIGLRAPPPALGSRRDRQGLREGPRLPRPRRRRVDVIGRQATGAERALLGDAVGARSRRSSRPRASPLAGLIVNFFGYVDVYAPQGKIGFTITQIDVQGLLGDVARRRRRTHRAAQREGLLEANKNVAALAGAAARRTRRESRHRGLQRLHGQLLQFRLRLRDRAREDRGAGRGGAGPDRAAIEALDGHGVDIICVVRGGGSKGDLACFDDERVARAIAALSTPVFTGIGHTGDESVADLVAHTRAITPTKLGEEIAAHRRQGGTRATCDFRPSECSTRRPRSSTRRPNTSPSAGAP
jgi:hypothetical protein